MDPRTSGESAPRRQGWWGRRPPWVLLILLVATSTSFRPVRAADDDLVVSVYQGVCREGDFAANLASARTVVKEALSRGSHFVALPECFLSGYESVEAVRRGARSLDDPELAGFIEESASHEMVVLVGLARKAKDGLYNSVLVIARGRLLGVYDKVMLTGGDREVLGFKPGTAVPVFSAHGVRFAAIICHDSSFPHAAMAARLQGATLLFSPHNNEIGAEIADDHRLAVRNCHVGLASQLKMVVARANVVKSDREGRIGYGDSFVLSPQGTPIVEAGLFRTELATARVARSLLETPSVWADDGEVPAWLRIQLAQMLTEFRRAPDDAALKTWLENMIVHHRFTPPEVAAATGLTLQEVRDASRRLELEGVKPRPRRHEDPLLVLPYPGGRHPRIGFLNGAVMPQRETKLSVFTPWDDASYVVVDVPEAVFSNLGLIYLAHTHIPTIWDAKGVALPRLEWRRDEDGSFHSERTLPNGIAFGADVTPSPTGVRMGLWLRNGTDERLTGLRVQNCVMLAGARGFVAQTNANKVFRPPYAAARSEDGRRWVVTAWEPNQRCWGNPDCPCLHSDPQFPDCEPGETVRLRGVLSFYAGDDLDGELKRIAESGWRE